MALLLLTLGLAACGSDDDDGPGGADDGGAEASAPDDDDADDDDGASIDACSLLSEDEVADVLGAPATSGPGTGPGASVCTWSDDAGRTITISVGSPRTAPGNEFDPARVNGLGTAEEVASLGGAFYVGIGTVAFASGDRLHMVQVATGATAEEDRAAAEELAPLVDDRIEQAAG